MSKKILWIGAAVAAAWWFVNRKKTAVENLQFALVGIRPDLSNPSLPQIEISLQITNKSAELLQVNGIAGELAIGDTIFGTAVATLPQQIPAGQQLTVPVKVRIFNDTLLQAVKNFITNIGGPAANFVFRGSVNFLNTNFPVNLSYKLI